MEDVRARPGEAPRPRKTAKTGPKKAKNRNSAKSRLLLGPPDTQVVPYWGAGEREAMHAKVKEMRKTSKKISKAERKQQKLERPRDARPPNILTRILAKS